MKSLQNGAMTYLKDPGTNIPIANMHDMLCVLNEAWKPILAKYGDGIEKPDWKEFEREYKAELPPRVKCDTPVLSDQAIMTFLGRRSPRKGSGLDGWTTKEAKALPVAIVGLFGRTLRRAQELGRWPSAIHHVPNPCLKKGDGEFPLEQRLLSVMSVWYYAWAANAYRALDGWRAQWTHNTSYGAVAGSTIQDVAWGLALRIEAPTTAARSWAVWRLTAKSALTS